MAFDDELAARVREILGEFGPVDERKMFGGIAFMYKGYMCCGVLNDDLVARIGPEAAVPALEAPDVRPMDLTGRPMKGYVYVAPDGVRTEAMIRRWVRACLDFVETLPAR